MVNLSITHFMGSGQQVGLGLAELVQILSVVLVPAAAGMAARHWYPRLAERAVRPVTVLSVVFLVLAVVATAYGERDNLVGYLAAASPAALAFSVLSLAVGYGIPRLLDIDHRQSIASAMEIGVHSSTLAITIALSPELLGNAEMAIPAAVYAFVVFGTATLFGRLANRRAARSPRPAR